MLSRVVTAVVGLPLMGFFLISGGFTLRVALLIVVTLGIVEFYNIVGVRSDAGRVVGHGVAGLYILALPGLATSEYMLSFLLALIIVNCAMLVLFHRSFCITDAAQSIMGFFYVAFLLGFVLLVRESPSGVWLVWLVFISAWGADTCAYFTGKTLGRHKLFPSVSPSKTVEGAVGGVVGASVIAMLYGWAVGRVFDSAVNTDIYVFGVIAAVSSVMSVFGDLSASAVKRYVGVKDFGSIFPGHGGVLDRFDSVLFAAPSVYVLLSLV